MKTQETALQRTFRETTERRRKQAENSVLEIILNNLPEALDSDKLGISLEELKQIALEAYEKGKLS